MQLIFCWYILFHICQTTTDRRHSRVICWVSLVRLSQVPQLTFWVDWDRQNLDFVIGWFEWDILLAWDQPFFKGKPVHPKKNCQIFSWNQLILGWTLSQSFEILTNLKMHGGQSTVNICQDWIFCRNPGIGLSIMIPFCCFLEDSLWKHWREAYMADMFQFWKVNRCYL